ncbi:metalloregulator ArsR/SmtB family transcription factor [uncultured Croceitalea sp.]|uniref:ArsR/SmtB family transcription factor n=1 Tax=uncultured Croceitalea sp. TaxID=1798908 RepID=UPI0033059006
MIARRDVFQAIADPTRRQIMTMLADKKMNVNSISDEFDMTRQAISLHVKILQECNLISIEKEGRERVCKAQFEQLSEVDNWLSELRGIWESRFNRLDSVLLNLKKNNEI